MPPAPSEAPLPRVGFIGLGAMGAPMAECLIEKGFRPNLWARRAASLSRFAHADIVRATSPAELGSRSDVVGICVFNDDDVRAVLLGADGVFASMARGGVVAIHATISVETIDEIARKGAEQGIALLDAPISGGPLRAANGTLAILAGGDTEALEKARPMLTSFGSSITHVGPAGRAQAMKLVNNALASANVRLGFLAVETAVRLGIDRATAYAVLNLSSGASAGLAGVARGLFDDAALCARHLPMNSKDLGLFQALREGAGIDASLLDTAAWETNRMFADRVGQDFGTA